MAANEDEAGRLARLEQQFQEISGRLAALERGAGKPTVAAPAPSSGAQEPDQPMDEEPTFSYAGRGQFGQSRMKIQQRARLSDVLNAEPDALAKIFAALASPARVALLRGLLDGPRTSQQLRRDLDGPSVGQLYHHLRELLAAGLIVQPGRSMYAIPRGSEVALCVQIIAAWQLAQSAQGGASSVAELQEDDDAAGSA